MKLIISVMLVCSFLSIGCEATRRGAQEIGKPIGGVTKTVGGVTEGAAESYGDFEDDNPFNR